MPYEEVCYQRLEQDNPEDYEKLKRQKKQIGLNADSALGYIEYATFRQYCI